MKISRLAGRTILAGLMGLFAARGLAQGHNHDAAMSEHATKQYTCPMHPEVVAATPGNCPKCGMKLVAEGAKMGGPTISVSISPTNAVAASGTTEFTIKLTSRDGKPVAPDQLQEAHTEKIHLLVVDPSLTDYHHVHPTATATAGTYAFSLTPKLGGSYKVFAELVPTATGKAEYASTSFTVAGSPSPLEKSINTEATVDGYKVSIAFERADIVAGEPSTATVKISGPDGQPFGQLEPIMGAYAHLVAFSEDRSTVAHIHPLDAEPQQPTDRGGPSLRFHLQFPEAGYQRLFAQFQIGGKEVFVPFGLDVKPAAPQASSNAGKDDAVKLVNNTKCPISGEDVGSMEEGASVTYGGYKVGLCCMGCEKTFLKNPDANLKKAMANAGDAAHSH